MAFHEQGPRCGCGNRRAEKRLRELKDKENKQAGRLETRQKIVAGAILLKEVKQNAKWREWFIGRLRDARRQDRNAFPQWFKHEPPPKSKSKEDDNQDNAQGDEPEPEATATEDAPDT